MPIREIKIQVRVVVDRDGDGFHAYAPDLKGVHATGDTEQEALSAAKEGVSLYVQSLVKHNESIPVGLLVIDREHASFLSMIWCLVKERFSPRRHSFVEEISVPTNGFALAN